jgi:hypothetical protein
MAKSRLGVCGAVALLATVCMPLTAANAAPVTESLAFSASGFTIASGSGTVPVDPWFGSFTIMFDPTGGLQSGVPSPFSTNLTSYEPFSYVYLGSSSGGTLVIYNDTTCTSGGSSFSCSLAGPDRAALELVVTASGGVSFVDAGISTTSSSTAGTTIFGTETGTVNPTPLPAALPLFATGIGGLGLLGWRKKRKAQAA